MLNAKRRTAVSEPVSATGGSPAKAGQPEAPEKVTGVNGASMRTARAGTALRPCGESIWGGAVSGHDELPLISISPGWLRSITYTPSGSVLRWCVGRPRSAATFLALGAGGYGTMGTAGYISFAAQAEEITRRVAAMAGIAAQVLPETTTAGEFLGEAWLRRHRALGVSRLVAADGHVRRPAGRVVP